MIDGFFVCYAGKLGDPFDMSKLIIVPWQVEAKSQAASEVLVGALTSPPIVEKCNGKTIRLKRDILVILMDLAMPTGSASNKGRVQLTHTAAIRPTDKKGEWKGYAGDDEQEPTRYCLNIRGHKSTTYPVLSDSEVDTRFSQLFRRSLACAELGFLHFLEEMDDDMERMTLPSCNTPKHVASCNTISSMQ